MTTQQKEAAFFKEVNNKRMTLDALKRAALAHGFRGVKVNPVTRRIVGVIS